MSEVPLLPWWATLILAIWAPVGPLVGILVAHYLLRSWQRRQWQADNRIQEWRELIATLMSSFTTILRLATLTLMEAPYRQDLDAHGIRAIEVIGNRIFINEDVEQIQLLDQWSGDAKKFSNRFQEIMTKVKAVAKKDIANI